MANCNKCGGRIGFVLNGVTGKWRPVEYDSIDYDNDKKNDEGQIIWDADTHRSHRCVYARPTEPPPQQTESHYDVLCVTKAAPKQVIQAAYRALAKIHHPDVGGSLQKMQELNRAWEALK